MTADKGALSVWFDEIVESRAGNGIILDLDADIGVVGFEMPVRQRFPDADLSWVEVAVNRNSLKGAG